MSTAYEAPISAQRLAIRQTSRLTGLADVPDAREFFGEVTESVLESAGKFAREVLSPLNRVGDQSPSQLHSGRVITPPGFANAYRRYAADGWTSLGAPAAHGGQGLPHVLGAAATEMWGSANLAFAMCPELTVGVVAALQGHAAPAL